MFHTKSGGQNFRTAASCSVLSRGHPAPHVLALFTIRRAPELPTAGRGAHLEVVSRTTAIEEILSDVARVRADTRTPRLGFFSAVDEACNEIPAFIDQLDIICFTNRPRRHVNSFPSVVLLGDGVTAITDTVDRNRLGGSCHPPTHSD